MSLAETGGDTLRAAGTGNAVAAGNGAATEDTAAANGIAGTAVPRHIHPASGIAGRTESFDFTVIGAAVAVLIIAVIALFASWGLNNAVAAFFDFAIETAAVAIEIVSVITLFPELRLQPGIPAVRRDHALKTGGRFAG